MTSHFDSFLLCCGANDRQRDVLHFTGDAYPLRENSHYRQADAQHHVKEPGVKEEGTSAGAGRNRLRLRKSVKYIWLIQNRGICGIVPQFWQQSKN